MEAANLPSFLKFRNAKKSDLSCLCKKIMGGYETVGAGAKLGAWGPVPSPGPGLKPALGSPPEKSPSADNLPATIRSARRTPGRDGFLPVNCLPRETFLGRQVYNGDTFYGAGDILIRGRHIKFVIISPRVDFSWGDILM